MNFRPVRKMPTDALCVAVKKDTNVKKIRKPAETSTNVMSKTAAAATIAPTPRALLCVPVKATEFLTPMENVV